MTLKQAYEAGDKMYPVVYNGIRYKRILRCGYTFTGQGAIIPFAELLSEEDRSIVVAKVELVSVAEDKK